MDGCDADSDSLESAFSFTMYEIDFGERQHADAPKSGMQAHLLPQIPRRAS